MNTLSIARFLRARILFWIVPASLLLATPGCSTLFTGDDDDDTANAAALLLLLTNSSSCGCQIGNVCFTASGVTCANGTASGSGSLIADSIITDDLSVEVTFQLASGGQLDFIGGANPNSSFTSSSGANLQFPATGNLKTATDGGAGVSGPGTSLVTYCMEHHAQESPIHSIMDKQTCSAKTASSASYEDDTSTPSSQGGRWGFILSDATITGVTRNSTRFFTE